MLNGKIVVTLVGLTLAILAICNSNIAGQPVVENWWNAGGFTTVARPVLVNTKTGEETAYGGNYLNPNMGSGQFFSAPQFQAVLSPRFSNLDYGALIRYNQPDRANMASPCEPLTFGDMASNKPAPQPAPQVKENYCGGNSGCGVSNPPSCGKGGYGMGHQVGDNSEVPPGYTNGNFQQVYDSLRPDAVSAGSDLPIGTMSTMDGFGNQEQFVAFNRVMVANTKSSSRLRSQGDPVRGDLSIAPNQSGWFSVYPDIARDVQEGAMNVLTDVAPTSSQASLYKLIMQASGGAQTALAGVNLAEYNPSYANVNMAGQSMASLSAAANDVTVTAFP